MDSQNYNSRSNVQPIVNQNLNTSSPAIQASVSISTGNGYGFILRLNQISFVSYTINLTSFLRQTNLGQISSNGSLNEYGIQHITIPGMQISIGPAHISTNNLNSNGNLYFLSINRLSLFVAIML